MESEERQRKNTGMFWVLWLGICQFWRGIGHEGERRINLERSKVRKESGGLWMTSYVF